MTTASDIMTREVATVEPEMSFREALNVLQAEGVNGAPVVRNGRVVGVISGTDILEFEATHPGVPAERALEMEGTDFEASDEWEDWVEGDDSPAAFFVDLWADAGADVSERFRSAESPEWDQLEEHVVSEVMTRKVVAVARTTGIREVARRMIAAEIHRVLVLDGDMLLGIVTTTDVVRAVAEGWGADREPAVGAGMSAAAPSTGPDPRA